MKGKIYLILILALLCLTLVNAQEMVPVKVVLQNEEASFSQVIVDYEIKSFTTEEIFYGTIQSNDDNEVEFELAPAFYEFSLSVNNPETSGYDYFGKISSKIDSSSTFVVNMFSVGSLEVLITDKTEKPMADVLIKIDCENNRGQQGYFRTDDFGIIDVKQIPTGSCIIRAAFEDFIISKNVNIEQGSKEKVNLVFTDHSSSSYSFVWIIIFVFVFLILIWLGFLYYNKKQIPVSQEKSKSSKEDIITALNETEKKVVKFMLEEQNKFIVDGGRIRNFYVNQAKIIYGAKIPKTTLVRLLQSLENKQILLVEKEGKIKKIGFTEWFRAK